MERQVTDPSGSLCLYHKWKDSLNIMDIKYCKRLFIILYSPQSFLVLLDVPGIVFLTYKCS